jgi:ATP:ADP antiporter, AAA family
MENTFGRLRGFFWPIYRTELPKFLPLLGIFFIISFIYNILRSYKDTLVITQASCGAEVLAFIKIWAVLPSAVLMTYIFTRLSQRFTKERVFYMMICFFIGFFLFFALVLYPVREFLHPHGLADRIQNILPKGCAGLVTLFRNWTLTLFYVMSELWSSMIFTVLFWSFANEVTSVGEARRFYGLLGIGGNLADICAGATAIFFSKIVAHSWDQSIVLLAMAILLGGVCILLLFRQLAGHLQTHASIQECPARRSSFREQIGILLRSRYLLWIAFIVLGYNIAIHLVEVVWKQEIKLLFPAPNEYNAYMGKVMMFMGTLATFAGLLATYLLRRISWTLCALIPPLVVGASGMFFFSFLLYNQVSSSCSLFLIVTLGSIQNCFSRASKYTFFDATKEISYIPLSPDMKRSGKAAIDGIGSRLGKSGGSVIHQGLLILCSSISASTPYIALIFVGIVIGWGYAVTALGKQFEQQRQTAL